MRPCRQGERKPRDEIGSEELARFESTQPKRVAAWLDRAGAARPRVQVAGTGDPRDHSSVCLPVGIGERSDRFPQHPRKRFLPVGQGRIDLNVGEVREKPVMQGMEPDRHPGVGQRTEMRSRQLFGDVDDSCSSLRWRLTSRSHDSAKASAS